MNLSDIPREPSEEGSIMERVANRLRTGEVLSGSIAEAPYAGIATLPCTFEIRLLSDGSSSAAMAVQIHGDSEKIIFDITNGEILSAEIYEPAEYVRRYLIILYHAAGLGHLVEGT